MRLALVGDWFLPRLGGIELQMRDIALRLRERGHDVEIITPVPGPSRLDGLRVHRIDAPKLPGAGIVFTAQAFREMRALLARGRYDAVEVHFGIVAPAAYGATFIAQGMQIPTLATFHSVLSHFQVPLWLTRGAMGVPNWRVEWAAVSSVVAESIRPLVGGRPVAILPNGVDSDWWSSARQSTPDARCLTAVSVMRLHRRKRPYALLDAVAAVVAELPADRRLRLRIIGDGAERKRLERAIARRRLDGVVTLCGWLPAEAVRRELHAADLFLLPSRLEAFGIAALEARCAGLPVIAMAAGGARDFLTDGHDALLASSDREFASHLHAAITDDALRQRLAAACATPPTIADWVDVLDRHEELLRAAGARLHEAADGRHITPRNLDHSKSARRTDLHR